MSLSVLVLLGSLSGVPALFENNMPHIHEQWVPAPARLTYRQPQCTRYTSTPRVTTDGSSTTIVHDETDERCFSSGDNRDVAIGVFPVGVHTVRYEQRRRSGEVSGTDLTFRVREESGPWRFGFYPPEPLALEPIDVEFDWLLCEPLKGVEAVDGGFRIVLDRGTSDGFDCDAITRKRMRLGALPPGTYRVTLVSRGANRPDNVLTAHDLVVTPGPVPADRFDHNDADYSGLWWSPADAPMSGLDVVHSRDAADTYGESYTVFWYTYDTNGAPVWYVITARRETFTLRGEVRRFASANPAAPLADRIAQASVVGTATLYFGNGDDPGEVRATIDGVEQRFRIERFRWQRAGWRY